jgi:hypothetical protein
MMQFATSAVIVQRTNRPYESSLWCRRAHGSVHVLEGWLASFRQLSRARSGKQFMPATADVEEDSRGVLEGSNSEERN